MSNSKETLSSNSLFHFTNSAEQLISILKHRFRPKYCLEDLRMFKTAEDETDDWLELAIPMICFCDIPLSKIKHHLTFYGNYGIGLTKKWGIKHGVSPLLYVGQDSETTKSLRMIFEEYHRTSEQHQSIWEMGQAVMRFLRFTKPYEGQFWRNGEYLQGVRFYDEREWRYVPEIQPDDDLTAWIAKSDYLDDIKRSALNEILADKYTLHFEPDDIKYIIVENEDQILSIISAVERIKGQFDPEIIKKLTSRIITRQQIIEDF